MRSRGELVISMTLAETFLLLVFMLAYSIKPKVNHPPVRPEVIAAENERLKMEVAALKNELADIQRRLDFWRKKYDQPIPGSEEELQKFLFEAGRGRPKCQDDNVLFDISMANGISSIRVLANSPPLRSKLSAEQIDLTPGSILTNPLHIETVLNAVQAFRKSAGPDGNCRFDYRFAYATNDDYYAGRERFEKYFYSAGRRRIN